MTRIEQARRNVRIARTVIGVSAGGAFALFAGLARASHPARHSTTVSSRSSVTESDSYFGDSSDSYSYLGPSGGATPQVQSGGS